MDHHEAEQSQAVARYILNEMSDDERDRFEEHYFDCRDCGADVLAAERMRANVPVPEPVPQPEPVPPVVPFPPRPAWKRAFDMAVAAMLAVVVTYLAIPRIQAPVPPPPPVISLEVLDEPLLLRGGENRGPDAPPNELRAGMPKVVVVSLGEVPFARYEIQLRNAAGKVVATSRVSANVALNGRVELLLRSLPAGSYVLAVHGLRTDGNRAVIATHPIRVREVQ